jgi:hypothetical protein
MYRLGLLKYFVLYSQNKKHKQATQTQNTRKDTKMVFTFMSH